MRTSPSRAVFLTTTGFAADVDDGAHRYTAHVIEVLTQQLSAALPSLSAYRLVTRPADADIILFVEPPVHKTGRYARCLAASTIIRDYPERCFVYDWEDDPAGFMPGVYASMPYTRMDPIRYRAGGYLMTNNERVLELARQADTREPKLLASFRGANTAQIREWLFNADFGDERIRVTRIDKWFNHDDADKNQYVEEMLDSRFVLCPRGFGTSSHRQIETMALGRVPVILSDAWSPPLGIPWSDFSLRVAEDRIGDLPAILDSHVADWRPMAEQARAAWHAWYSPEMAFSRVLHAIEDLLLMRPAGHDERRQRSRWFSPSFAIERRWTLPQRVAARVRKRLRPAPLVVVASSEKRTVVGSDA